MSLLHISMFKMGAMADQSVTRYEFTLTESEAFARCIVDGLFTDRVYI